MLRFFRRFKEWLTLEKADIPPDPRKHCELLRREGCAHVDGYLCDTRTCAEKREFDKILLKGKLKLIVNDQLNQR